MWIISAYATAFRMHICDRLRLLIFVETLESIKGAREEVGCLLTKHTKTLTMTLTLALITVTLTLMTITLTVITM